MKNPKNRLFLLVFCECFLAFVFPSPVSGQTSYGSLPLTSVYSRSFDQLFPGLSEEQKNEIFSETGLIHSPKKDETLELIPAAGSGIDISGTVMKTKPSYLAESLLVVPYSTKVLDKLDAYNALGKIQDLKGRVYHSFTRKAEIPLFEDATRLESAKKTNPIPDPRPASVLPSSETVYLRLKDVNFGNSYYRADVSASVYGVTYSLTNFKSLSYLFFTVMKEEKFNAILYLEPLTEGMLVYSVAGADASDFIAKKVDIPSAISKRLEVFIGWVSDNLKKSP